MTLPAPLIVRLLTVVPFEITPPNCTLRSREVKVRVVPAPVPSEIAPAPKFIELVEPIKAKSAAQVCGLAESVMEAALASMAPPLITKVLVAAPRAAALPNESVPALRVTVLLPPKVLTPLRINVPAPFFVRLNAPLRMPVRESALAVPKPPMAAVVIVRSAVKVTAPGKVRAPLPRKFTSAPKVMAPAVVPTTAAPEVLLIEPPFRATVPAAAPRASGTFTLTVPALSVKPVEKVLAPPRVRVPVPALVRLKAPPMIPPTCSVLALTVTVRLAFNVTAPVPRLSEFVPVKVKLLLQA